MHRGAILVAFGACRFDPGVLPRDGAVDVAVDAGPPYCNPADPALVACYSFDGNANDGSTHALNAVTANVSFVTGKVGMAMDFGATSAADVPENAAVDVPFITIEAWIKPTTLPGAGARMGILDNNGQYGFFLYEGGNMRCIASNTVSQTSGTITAGAWHHVACTHDGSTTTLYVDGAMVGQISGGAALGSGGTTGISLAADNPPGNGSRLIGLIDELRMLSIARTATEICEDAGTCVP